MFLRHCWHGDAYPTETGHGGTRGNIVIPPLSPYTPPVAPARVPSPLAILSRPHYIWARIRNPEHWHQANIHEMCYPTSEPSPVHNLPGCCVPPYRARGAESQQMALAIFSFFQIEQFVVLLPSTNDQWLQNDAKRIISRK